MAGILTRLFSTNYRDAPDWDSGECMVQVVNLFDALL